MDSENVLLCRIEETRLWGYFHKDWLLAIRSLLRAQLPPEYHLFVESEAILVSPITGEPPNPLLPDVAISHPVLVNPETQPSRSRKGTAAIVEVDEPCETQTTYSLLIRHAPENHVVAVLEILSPSNKGGGNRFDEEKHLRKRSALLEAGIQLLEVNALVEGHRELPAPLMQTLGKFARVAWTATHFDGRRRYQGWGWNEADPLPMIPWLLDRRTEVYVDLADSVAQAFEFNRWPDLVASAAAKSSRTHP